jgi:hypothetical protein
MMIRTKKLTEQGVSLSHTLLRPAFKERGHLTLAPFTNLVGVTLTLLDPHDRNVASLYFPRLTMKNSLLKLTAFLAVLATLLVSALAETASTVTNTLTVDTRGSGDLTVKGRILNANTQVPLAGATAALAGLSGTSVTNGSFTLSNVDRTLGSSLALSAAGFISQNKSISPTPDVKTVDVGDILLASATGKPVVESLALTNPKGVYLRGLPEAMRGTLSRPTAEAKVNWNGNPPGNVEFWADGALVGTKTGAGPSYTLAIPIDTAFKPTAEVHQLKISQEPRCCHRPRNQRSRRHSPRRCMW